MSDTIQQIIVVAAILGAVLYLAFRGRKKNRGKGGCGCGPKKTPTLDQ